MAALGAAECLRSGMTTVVDAAYSGAAVAACSAAGLRAIVAIEAFGGDDADAAAVVAAARRTAWMRSRPRPARASSSRSRRMRRSRSASRSSPRWSRLARAREMRVVTHLGESRHELDAMVGGTGRARALRRALRPPSRSSSWPSAGCSAPRRWSRTRCTSRTPTSPALAATGAAVAHCPRSNALLGCGVAPLARLRAAGIRVGLGTDSPSSALSLDMFDELRAALMLARASAGDPEALSTAAALQMATLDGARALGLDDRGALAPGHARRPDRGAARPHAVLAQRRPGLRARARRFAGTRDTGRDRRQRAVRCGFDRFRARPPRSGGRALAPPRTSRDAPTHDHLDPHPQGLGRRHLLRRSSRSSPSRSSSAASARAARRRCPTSSATTTAAPGRRPRRRRASATLQKRVKANPKNADAWQQLADAYAAQQNPALTRPSAWGQRRRSSSRTTWTATSGSRSRRRRSRPTIRTRRSASSSRR